MFSWKQRCYAINNTSPFGKAFKHVFRHALHSLVCQQKMLKNKNKTKKNLFKVKYWN